MQHSAFCYTVYLSSFEVCLECTFLKIRVIVEIQQETVGTSILNVATSENEMSGLRMMSQ